MKSNLLMQKKKKENNLCLVSKQSFQKKKAKLNNALTKVFYFNLNFL